MWRTMALITAAILSVGVGNAATLTEKWRVTGFDLPESVSYDAARNAYYVSNLGTDPSTKDGNGFISRLNADGSIATLKWVTGLNAPKGTLVVENKLYVTDIDELVEIDTGDGKVLNRYPVPGALFLNDLALAVDGRIFISDTFGNAIYLFEDGKISEWLRDPALLGPNGLTIVGADLVVASLGDLSGGFANMKPANVRAVDLETKEIGDFGTADPIGNLDGIEPTADGAVLVTDNPAGRILEVKPAEKAVEIGTVPPGSADFEYVPGLNLLILPEMQQNMVVAYNWP